MNLLILSDWNLNEQKKRLVMNELLVKHKERIDEDKYCYNCGSNAVEEYSTTILWCKYKFCSGWCQYDVASDLRKSYRMATRLNN
jgi:hypothetical protein